MQNPVNTLRFSTARLDIRDMAPMDCDYAASEWGHPVYGRYMADPPYAGGDELRGILASELENHERWTDDFYLSVFLRATGELVGTACAYENKEPGDWGIGYSISHRLWGKGLATELIGGLVRFVEGCGARKVSAIVAQANTASVRACARNGFQIQSEGSFTKGGTKEVHASYTLCKLLD